MLTYATTAGHMNAACGDDSDCINRLTLMECSNDCCGCQRSCLNQRFQNREYADVSVFKAGNKGYGLRADSDIQPGRFIYEYVGDVIDEPRFRQRSVKYAQEGVKHFYFMSLEKDQFIDATKKGGLARFVNHSCNPNCETEKWVVGKKFRMGIFAKRHIKAGEELVFDYNVDRYGAEKQPCYCGEPNCLGYIGGKTQTDSAPKLSENLIAALGIDDEDEMMPTKKNRRPRKTGEDDGDYMAKVASRPLTYKDVAKVMGTLQNTKERWIVSRLLSRIQRCDDDEVFARVLQFHGYGIIGKFLTSYKDDETIVTAILDIFMAFPKLTKNKITAANIEPIVEELAVSVNDDICHKANDLLEEWSTLQTMYRIPRRLAGEGEGDAATAVYLDRGRSLSQPESPESPAKLKEPSLPPWLANKQKKQQVFDKQPPKGPRAERFGNQNFHKTPRPNKFFGRPNANNPNMIQLPVQSQVDSLRKKDLPWGWYRCYQFNECYYYSNDGLVSWEIPTTPAISRLLPKTIPTPPPKPAQMSDVQIILQEMKERAEKEERLEMEKKRKQEEDEERERQERRARRKAKEKEKEGKLVYDAEKTKRYLNISVCIPLLSVYLFTD
jgi:SET domain-containing protein